MVNADVGVGASGAAAVAPAVAAAHAVSAAVVLSTVLWVFVSVNPINPKLWQGFIGGLFLWGAGAACTALSSAALKGSGSLFLWVANTVRPSWDPGLSF